MTTLALVAPAEHQPNSGVDLACLVYLEGTLERPSASGEMKLVCIEGEKGLAKLYEYHRNGLSQHIAKIILKQFYESTIGTMMKTPFINKDHPTAGPWSANGVMKMLQVPDLTLGGNQRLRSRISTAMESNTEDKVVISAVGYQPQSAIEPSKYTFINSYGQRVLNTFVGSKVAPVPSGDASPFTTHVEYLCGHDMPQAEHMLDWMAYSVQNPERKIGHAVLIGSRHGGTGKSLLLNTMAIIMNRTNVNTINVRDLHNSKQDWLIDKTMVIVEEVKDLNLSDMNNLKTLITEPTIMADKKFGTYQQEINHANFIFTSNFERSLYLPDSANARRYFVVFSELQPKHPCYYESLTTWLEHNDGYGIVLGHMLERDLSHFNAMEPPPETAAKTRLMGNSKTDFELFVQQWANGTNDEYSTPIAKVFTYKSVEDALKQSPYTHERGKTKRISEFLLATGCVKKRVHVSGAKGKTLWFNQLAVQDGLHHQPYGELRSVVIDDTYPF
jgi:hypothetical protein